MKKKEITRLPKNFFKQDMKIIPLNEAIKNVKPIEWDNDILEGKAKVTIEPLYDDNNNIDEDKLYFKIIKH